MRAVAALTVLFTHVERMRQPMGMAGLIDFAFNSFIGGLAVTFFFVLSGFLITALLLAEKSRLGTIRLKRFLVNRALRIWPLYYLSLVAGYAISIFLLRETGSDPLRNGLLMNLVLLPNFAFALGLLPDILIQLWSVGTEEQFYFAWPFLIRRFSEAKLTRLFIAVIFIWLAARGMVRVVGGKDSWLNVLLFRTRIDCMAVGGLAALLLYFRERSEGWWSDLHLWLLQRRAGWIAAGVFIFLLWVSYRYDVSLYQLYAGLSAILILRVIHIPRGAAWLESGLMRYLGKISYGIYLLQHFIIFLLFEGWLKNANELFPGLPAGSRLAGILVFLVTALLTVGLASVSYRFYELRFLKRKY
ncbi:MAG TPA: acyltransferase [Puia sp.]|nr:acyltransferase [Puia sp.]